MYNSDYNRPPEEREPIETEHFHVWDAESPKPPRKKIGAVGLGGGHGDLRSGPGVPIKTALR